MLIFRVFQNNSIFPQGTILNWSTNQKRMGTYFVGSYFCLCHKSLLYQRLRGKIILFLFFPYLRNFVIQVMILWLKHFNVKLNLIEAGVSQFHQRFTHAFFVRKSFWKLFSASSLALNKLLYENFARKMLIKLKQEAF